MNVPTTTQTTTINAPSDGFAAVAARGLRHRRSAGLMLAAVFAASTLAACGGSDGPVAADDPTIDGPVAASSSDSATSSSEAGTGSATESGEGDAPVAVATIPSTLPEDIVGQVGEVEVIGEPLPKLGKVSIEADPARGTKAPVLIGESFDGEEIRVDAAATGRPTLLFFFAHWCPHCNNEIPILNDLRDSNAFRPDLDIYAVSTAIKPEAPNFPPSKWIKNMDWTYPTIVDGIADDQKTFLANESFGSSGFPFAVLINADGTVAARWSGEAPGGGPTIISNIETYLAY